MNPLWMLVAFAIGWFVSYIQNKDWDKYCQIDIGLEGLCLQLTQITMLPLPLP